MGRKVYNSQSRGKNDGAKSILIISMYLIFNNQSNGLSCFSVALSFNLWNRKLSLEGSCHIIEPLPTFILVLLRIATWKQPIFFFFFFLQRCHVIYYNLRCSQHNLLSNTFPCCKLSNNYKPISAVKQLLHQKSSNRGRSFYRVFQMPI